MWLLRGGSVTPFSTRFLSSRLVNFGLPFEHCRLVLLCCCSRSGFALRVWTVPPVHQLDVKDCSFFGSRRRRLTGTGCFLWSEEFSFLSGGSVVCEAHPSAVSLSCRGTFFAVVSPVCLCRLWSELLDWLIAVISFLSFRSSAWYEVLTDFFTWTVSVLLEIVQGLWSDFLTVWVLYPSPLAFDA